MKMVTYNIQEGGGDRLALIVDVIQQHRPDAVALQEVTSEQHVVTLARELDMQLVIGEGNSPYGIAWLSRLPIMGTRTHRLPSLSKGLLEIKSEWMGKPLRLFTTHLASRHDPQTPEQEMSVILEILGHSSSTPHLLTGDFNSLGPDDPVGQPPIGQERRGDAKDGAPRKTIQAIIDAGYTDCYRTIRPNEPGYTYPSSAPWLRLDYIFASPQLAPHLCDCAVGQDPRTLAASDHLPVWAEFRHADMTDTPPR